MWEITNPVYSSSCIFVNPPTHPNSPLSAHISLVFKLLNKNIFVIRLTLASLSQRKRLPICMPQHAIFWLTIAFFMLGFAAKYKLEHRSMSSGTSFHIIWNTLPHQLEHPSTSSGTMLHVSKTQSKDARTACKRIIKKGGKENKKWIYT